MKDYTSHALRAANEDDLEAVAGIWHRGWLDAHLGRVPEALVEHRQPEHFVGLVRKRIPLTTVAIDGDQVVGFVTVHDEEVEQIYVAAAARGGGVADALLRHAEEKIATRGAAAWLAVVAGNTRARRFYERNGWRDGGALEYAAEVSGGTISVPCRRYEKVLAR